MSQNDLFAHWLTVALIYRSLLALVGVVFAVLGYRLYSKRIRHDIGSASISRFAALTGAGPGAIFALFGVTVVCWSIAVPPKFRAAEFPEPTTGSGSESPRATEPAEFDPNQVATEECVPAHEPERPPARVMETNFDPPSGGAATTRQRR